MKLVKAGNEFVNTNAINSITIECATNGWAVRIGLPNQEYGILIRYDTKEQAEAEMIAIVNRVDEA